MRFYVIFIMFFFSQAEKLRGGEKDQQKTKRSASIELRKHPGLWPNDIVTLKGQFRKNKLQIRFISSEASCDGGRRKNSEKKNCQPLVMKFDPRHRLAEFYYKGKIGTHRDVLTASTQTDKIKPNLPYTLKIRVNKRSFTVIFNDEVLATVADRIGSEEVLKLRAYEGIFSNFYIERARVTCGMRPGLVEERFRIAGGSNARAGEFPWQASIRFKRKNSFFNFQHVCGATLINSCWLVTAAHCTIIPSKSLDLFVIRVGDYHNRNDSYFPYFEDVQEFDIEEIISHPNFTLQPSPRNDIALIRLRSNDSTCVAFSDFVQPICLPRANEDFSTRSSCVISGWGGLSHLQYPFQYPSVLQKGNVIIQDHRTCQNSHGKDETNSYLVANETVCASSQGVDACQGDSGGPMSCQRYENATGPHVLWGIVSWGDDCAHPQKAGVYTKVAVYLDWIAETINS